MSKPNQKFSILRGAGFAVLIVAFQAFALEPSQKSHDMSTETVQRFVDAINSRDVDKICSLMTDDHRFIDSQGNEITGKDTMRQGWKMYFEWFPDYKIEVSEMFVRDDTVAAFGYAGGSFHGLKERKDLSWRLPASWKAKVVNGKVAVWQVYADTKIPYEIISKGK